VDFWTSRDVREVMYSHVNYLVADTTRWEQSAAYYIDTHQAVEAFVKKPGWALPFPIWTMGSRMIMYPIFLYDSSSSLGYI